MHYQRRGSRNEKRTGVVPSLLVILIIITYSFSVNAQSCPPNIDFENGSFDGWTCYTGNTVAAGDENIIYLSPSGGPVFNRHTMYSRNSGQLDPFGGFPVSCPNGSGYSIKLGNTSGGNEAEGVSYEFTIPANDNNYSLIYHYAVVFQSPNHRTNEQPRMEIEVTNVTDNMPISCASFTFIAVGTSLPGFQVAPGIDTTTVLYKNWSAVSVDLAGLAGKKIRLFFKTADCTFRRHFGYAYIDVDSECSGSFVGATFCPDDSVVNVTAPYGYEGYTWYDSSLSRVLGSQQVLTFSPPPSSGTTVAVKLEPYNGYGCPKTMLAKLIDTLTVKSNAGKDIVSCNLNSVLIGAPPKAGLVYRWSPAAGLSDPNIANPFASPDKTTSYVVTTTSGGGGCRTTDTVVVTAAVTDNSIKLLGKANFCFGYGDSAVLNVEPTAKIQWYADDVAINGATGPTLRVLSSGTYYAVLTNANGCSTTTQKQTIVIDRPKQGITYPLEYAIENVPLVLKARQIGESAVWNPGTNLNTSASFTPTFKGAGPQAYTIDIRTSLGCLTVDTQQVKTIKKVEIFVPTAFTPNKDGKNDYLRPTLLGLRDVRYFRIFNRWGQLLYESRVAQPGWDGTFKGVAQPTQAVVWMIEGVGVDGVVYQQKGTTVLLR